MRMRMQHRLIRRFSVPNVDSMIALIGRQRGTHIPYASHEVAGVGARVVMVVGSISVAMRSAYRSYLSCSPKRGTR
jgi:hypothetical protein